VGREFVMALVPLLDACEGVGSTDTAASPQKELSGSRHSSLATPCEQGWDGGGVVVVVVRNDTSASGN
jgi:hypothetical protein